MNKLLRFDAAGIKLEGVNLLEASAGTGKTYSIQNIVLRLLLERDFLLENILVVSFTNASAAELRGRILEIIHQALRFCSGEECSDTERISALIGSADPEQCRKKLKRALADFDNSSIFTIHGFCQRVLSEQAFESRTLFNPAPAGDADELIMELERDYLRSLAYSFSDASGGTAGFAGELPKPGKIAALVREKLKYDHLDIRGGSEFKAILDGVDQILERLDKYKREHQLRFFDDLINDLHRQLIGKAASPLMKKILQEKYYAAVVDEFQDVDKKQYEIFESIFIDRPDPVFFMVGDVKQTIYGFRGGDAQIMHHAAETVKKCGGKHYFLPDNYRSVPALVNEVNRIFYRHPHAFADEKIIFFPSGSAAKALPLEIDGREDKYPLRIFYRSGTPGEKIPSVGDLKKQCFNDCAAAVLQILSPDSGIRIMPENRTPRLSDIAILARTNNSLDEMGKALTARNIPWVCFRPGNIYDTAEAKSLQLVIDALLDSGNPAAAVSALGSGFCGFPPPELVRMKSDGSLAEYLDIFRELAAGNEAPEFSFIQLFSRLEEKFDLKRKFSRENGGGRKMVNYLHLADLLQEKCTRERLKLPGLANYLRRQINPETRIEEDNQKLHLESSGEAVKLMTIHGSKGLEFNIVMLPELFSKSSTVPRDQIFPCQDKLGNYFMDLDTPEDYLAFLSRQRLAEDLRLLYVALTRGKYRVYLFWGDSAPGYSKSAMEWLLCGEEITPEGNVLEQLKQQLTQLIPTIQIDTGKSKRERVIAPGEETKLSRLLNRGALTAEMLENLPDETRIMSFQSSSLSTLPDGEKPELLFTPWQGKLNTSWRYWSYSSLTAAPEKEASAGADYDAGTEDIADEVIEETPPELEAGIFALPGGARLGNAWHRILENTDFTRPEQSGKTVRKILHEYAFDEPEVLDCTLQMISDLCKSRPLDNFSFGSLAFRDTLRELEFSCRLKRGFNAGNLFREIEARYGGDYGRGFDCEGMFCGFIDLLARAGDGKYYIVDWKSNSLGGQSVNFKASKLNEAMRRGRYHLQYIVYCTAFIKFFRQRFGKFDLDDYEKYFGGVLYVFLRGVKADNSGSGFYFDRPEYDFLMKTEAEIE